MSKKYTLIIILSLNLFYIYEYSLMYNNEKVFENTVDYSIMIYVYVIFSLTCIYFIALVEYSGSY